jgi:hypothetical protein
MDAFTDVLVFSKHVTPLYISIFDHASEGGCQAYRENSSLLEFVGQKRKAYANGTVEILFHYDPIRVMTVNTLLITFSSKRFVADVR